jgi:antitoxin (DNA-binding transcriptional repressor) of toxin-antitoxin stability system
MRAKNLSVTEVVRNFSDYLNRVAYRGESFILNRGGKAVAELRPLPKGTRLGDLPEILASLPRLSETEMKAYADDLRKIRESVAEEDHRDPWES